MNNVNRIPALAGDRISVADVKAELDISFEELAMITGMAEGTLTRMAYAGEDFPAHMTQEVNALRAASEYRTAALPTKQVYDAVLAKLQGKERIPVHDLCKANLGKDKDLKVTLTEVIAMKNWGVISIIPVPLATGPCPYAVLSNQGRRELGMVDEPISKTLEREFVMPLDVLPEETARLIKAAMDMAHAHAHQAQSIIAVMRDVAINGRDPELARARLRLMTDALEAATSTAMLALPSRDEAVALLPYFTESHHTEVDSQPQGDTCTHGKDYENEDR